MCNCPQDCHTLPCMHVTQPYSCPKAEPGYLREPYHLPGYCGHVPTMKTERIGGSFGKLCHMNRSRILASRRRQFQFSKHRAFAAALTRPVDATNLYFDAALTLKSGKAATTQPCMGGASREPICACHSGHDAGLDFNPLGQGEEGEEYPVDQIFLRLKNGEILLETFKMIH